MNTWNDVQELAQIGLNNLETRTRDNGLPLVYITRKDFAPGWLVSLMEKSIGDYSDFLPRYGYIRDALEKIAEYDNLADFLKDAPNTDVSTGDLIAWMGSDSLRIEAVDELTQTVYNRLKSELHDAPATYGRRVAVIDDRFLEFNYSLMDAIQTAQRMERTEVQSIVIETLERMAAMRADVLAGTWK